MQFKVFAKGVIRIGHPIEVDGKLFPVKEGQLDRTIVLDAESIEIIQGKEDRMSYRFLAFKNGKHLVGLIKDEAWDFVIPADGKIIYNDHGESHASDD